jgi:mono/diheme cytochrome c family protein
MARPFLKAAPLIAIAFALGGLMLWRVSASGKPQNGGNAGLGRAVFEGRCAPCHGKDGKGDGPYAMLLNPRPRDFTLGMFEYRTTESGSLPTDEDLKRTITKGLPGTAMPAWGRFVKGDSLDAVIAYVKTFSSRFESEQPRAVTVGSEPPASHANTEAGRKVYEKLQCASCHGTDGRGTGATATAFENASGYPVQMRDLTAPWAFRGGSTVRDIYMRFRTGLDGTPMPSFVGAVSDKEMWLLATYIVSLRRTPAWEMNEQELAAFYRSQDEEMRNDPAKWGKFLVDGMGCAECHTPLDGKGGNIESLRFAGGVRFTLGPYGEFVTANLTSDTATGLGGRTDEQIKNALTKGIRHDGTRMLPFPMPWTAAAKLKPEELNAIIAYLRTIPAIHNEIPDHKPLGFFPYMWGKFKMLVLKQDLAAELSTGNAGILKGGQL